MTDVLSPPADPAPDTASTAQNAAPPAPITPPFELETLLRRGQTVMIEERLVQAEATGSLEGYMPRCAESLFYMLMMQFTDRPLVSQDRVTLASFSPSEQSRMTHAALAAFLDEAAFEAAVVADPANEAPLRATRSGFLDMLCKARALPDPTHRAPAAPV
ncbi:MAG: hypothetical protein ACRBCL_01090 [Maritimibacter sp.]